MQVSIKTPYIVAVVLLATSGAVALPTSYAVASDEHAALTTRQLNSTLTDTLGSLQSIGTYWFIPFSSHASIPFTSSAN
ncbi:hypothetical protein EIP91_007360 [Steccherinum ochraceum]|uniref:Uncharacterized protein n=1 Tax=Steccherinum ochraceum TaxID=92696 RepID=A0A4R0RVE8_9APHY|nr:hypothetical protein EIP91_007360 [Steccherinum ochraceum]